MTTNTRDWLGLSRRLYRAAKRLPRKQRGAVGQRWVSWLLRTQGSSGYNSPRYGTEGLDYPAL